MAETIVQMTPMLVLGLLVGCTGAALTIIAQRGVWPSGRVPAER